MAPVDADDMPTNERVEINGLSLALRVWHGAQPGSAAVLLLHGTGGTAADWDTVAVELARDRTVYALDLRGHGASDWPGDYSLQLMASDVVGLLDHGLGPGLDVVGHSMGGLVACLALAERPDLVRRLVLEDVPLPHPRRAATPARPPGPLDFDWAVVEQVRPQIDRPAADWSDVVRRVPHPTLVIAGGDSSPMPQAHVREMAATLPAGRLETVDAGHDVHEAEPVRFLALVTAFLEP